MDLAYCISKLERQAEIIRQMVMDIDNEQAGWKPGAESWSVLEVMNHLYAEERGDFRHHLGTVFHPPADPPSDAQPPAWVTNRPYNQTDLNQVLESFLDERKKSLAWLSHMISPNWELKIKMHFGELSAADMAASWVAHDILHIRQLVELRWAYTTLRMQPDGVRYAGEW